MKEPTSAPSGRHITSEGMNPSVSMYQRTLTSKSGASSTRCPGLVTWGGSSAGRWESFTRTIWFGALWGIAGRTGGRPALGIAQMDDGAPPRSIRRDNWTTGGLRQLLEVLLRRNRQSKSDES